MVSTHHPKRRTPVRWPALACRYRVRRTLWSLMGRDFLSDPWRIVHGVGLLRAAPETEAGMAYRQETTIMCDGLTQPRDAALRAREWALDTARLLSSENGREVAVAWHPAAWTERAEACAKQAGGVIVTAEWDEGEALEVRAEPAGQ